MDSLAPVDGSLDICEEKADRPASRTGSETSVGPSQPRRPITADHGDDRAYRPVWHSQDRERHVRAGNALFDDPALRRTLPIARTGICVPQGRIPGE